MIKKTSLIFVLFLSSCSSNYSYDAYKFFPKYEKDGMKTQISQNSKNDELIEIITQFNSDKKQENFRKLNEILSDPKSDSKTIADAEMIMANMLLREGKNEEALEYFKLSAEHNNGYSQYKMYKAYRYSSDPFNLYRNDSLAFKYAKKSAENNIVKGQVALAQSYLYGEGVRKNTEISFYWTKMACQNGSEYSCEIYYGVLNKLNNQKLNL